MRRILPTLLLLAVAFPAGALAHEGDPNYLSQVTKIEPSTGLKVDVLNRDDRLLLVNDTGKEVVIEGYSGEPYVRLAADGTVSVNTKSAAYYLNEDRLGTTKTPAGLTKDTPPEWKELSKTARFEWHDHRAHWMGKGLPPQVTDESVRTKVFDWSVPMTVGGAPGAVSGELFWTPSESGVPAGAIAGGAVLIVLMAVAVLVVRRRRAAQGGASDGEAEAW